MLTLRLAPDQVLVVATVDLVDAQTTGAAVEELADKVDHEVRRHYPMVRHLYLDPTSAGLREPTPDPSWRR